MILRYTGSKKALQVRAISEGELNELNTPYHKTREARIRTRVQMILLAVKADMTAPEIARIVRKNDQTVRRWSKRFNAEGVPSPVPLREWWHCLCGQAGGPSSWRRW